VFKHLAPNESAQADPRPSLWGVEFPGPIASKAREFSR
jgi:hypothetical protein